jgi:hypothetical protein
LELEDLSPARLRGWLDFNRTTRERLREALGEAGLDLEDRLDLEAVLAHAEREIHALETRRTAERDPLFWTGLIGNATVFLLVRDTLAPEERARRARARVKLLPRLAAQAREALADPALIPPELCPVAARQARASAQFYREGWPRLAPGASEDGERAAAALETLARLLDDLGRRATGAVRLGPLYAETFRLGTGAAEPVEALLARAEADLVAKRQEAASFGRSVWKEILPGEAPPEEDRAVLRRLFARLAEDRARSIEEFVEDYRTQVRAVESFVREKGIVTLPDPLTILLDRSPSFFAGQSVGGVYPAGPYEPEAKTLFYLPAPDERASPEEKDAFFRDFNHHFNVMITPHEILPGHYLQLKWAARHPRKVRALFADEVYVEGWGTFCERLLLEEGWGTPLARLAHLKKQLENTARAIVDVRVHTKGMTREEVLAFVKEEALQDDQFAANMWLRAITTSPQIVSYWLGFRQVRGLYEDVKAARGASFRLRDFLDGMMELGPVPVRHYRRRLLAAPTAAGADRGRAGRGT